MLHTARNAGQRVRSIVTRTGRRGASSRASVPKSLCNLRNNQPVISVFDKESNEAWCQTRIIAGMLASQATFSLMPLLQRLVDVTGSNIKLVEASPTRQHITGKKDVGIVAMHASPFSISVNENGINKDLFRFLHSHLGNALFTEMPLVQKAITIIANYSAMIGYGTQPQNLTEYQCEAKVRSEIAKMLINANAALEAGRTPNGILIADLNNATGQILCPESQAIIYEQLLETKATWPTTVPIETEYMDPEYGIVKRCLTEFFNHDGRNLAQQNHQIYDRMNPNLLVGYSSFLSTSHSLIINEVDNATPLIEKTEKSKARENKTDSKPL